MKFTISKMLVLGFVAAGVTLGISRFFTQVDQSQTTFAVKEPVLSNAGMRGKLAFDENCAQCHGVSGSGTDNGPPLIHNIYNPGHHGDQSFFLAASRGVRAHHWTFGDMPPQRQVNPRQVQDIVRYIREVQEANGIFYQQHTM